MSIVRVDEDLARYVEHSADILRDLGTKGQKARELPHWNPDGTEVKSIAQAAAIMNLPEDIVAVHALTGGTDDLNLKIDASVVFEEKVVRRTRQERRR